VKFIHLFLCFRAKTQHFMSFVLGTSFRVRQLVYLHYTLILLFYGDTIHFIFNKFVVTENWLHSLKWHKNEKDFRIFELSWTFWAELLGVGYSVEFYWLQISLWGQKLEFCSLNWDNLPYQELWHVKWGLHDFKGVKLSVRMLE